MKKNVTEKIFILLIVVVLAGFAIFSGYKKYMDKQNAINKNTEQTEKQGEKNQELTEIEINNYAVNMALENFKRLSIDEESIYSKSKFAINEMTKKDLIITALDRIAEKKGIYSACDEEGRQTQITIEEVEEALKELIEQPEEITISDLIANAESESTYPATKYTIYPYGFNINGENITVIGSCGCPGVDESIREEKTIKAEKEGDYLYIYQKVAFGKLPATETEEITYNMYSDYHRMTNFIEIVNYNGEELSPITWDLYNTYKYTFKEKENTYYLESINIER